MTAKRSTAVPRAIVLRRTIGSWSGGTRVSVLSRIDDQHITVEPWCSDELLEVTANDLVERRYNDGLTGKGEKDEKVLDEVQG